MKRTITILVALLVPAAAVAAEYELGIELSYIGRVNVIARPPGYYDPGHKASVEVECDVPGQSLHLHMTTDEARELAVMLEDAANAAEEP